MNTNSIFVFLAVYFTIFQSFFALGSAFLPKIQLDRSSSNKNPLGARLSGKGLYNAALTFDPNGRYCDLLSSANGLQISDTCHEGTCHIIKLSHSFFQSLSCDTQMFFGSGRTRIFGCWENRRSDSVRDGTREVGCAHLRRQVSAFMLFAILLVLRFFLLFSRSSIFSFLVGCPHAMKF